MTSSERQGPGDVIKPGGACLIDLSPSFAGVKIVFHRSEDDV